MIVQIKLQPSGTEFRGDTGIGTLAVKSKLVRPDLPRCREKILTNGALGRVAGTPCKRPAVTLYGLCASHFRYYFGHRFHRGKCSCSRDNTTTELFCFQNGHSKRAKEILAEAQNTNV